MIRPITQAAQRLLKWSEQYTKADMSYIAKGSFWVFLERFGSGVPSLILVFIFANWLSKETYGLYQYVLSIIGILYIFTLAGMNSAVSQAAAAGKKGILRATVNHQIKWNMLMFIASLAIGSYYTLAGNWQLAFSIVLLGFFAPLTAALTTYSAYLQGVKAFRLNSIFSILSTIIFASAMAVVIITNGNFLVLIATYAIVSFITAGICYVLTLRIFKAEPTTDDTVITYGWKLSGIGIIQPIVGQIDKIIIASFWGASELAVYSLALILPAKATTSLKALMSIGYAKFVTRSITDINKVFFRRIFFGMAIGGVCALGYIILSPYLFKYLFPQYTDSIFYSQILALGLVCALPSRYIGLLLESHKFSKQILINQLAQALLRILLYIAFGIWSGIFGLVLAHTLLAYITLAMNIMAWKLEKEVKNATT